MSSEGKVAAHYGSHDLTERILTALKAAGQNVDRLAADALFPFDQMHGRQLAATREHVARLDLNPAKHALDVGSGVGGPARYMASTFGCRVTGIDLTETFVTTARDLTARCGLSQLAGFHLGSALAMPFDDGEFDAATCQYVAMNIADKAALLREIARVLKPGGRLVFSCVVAGAGEPLYPLPWAREPSVSFLISGEALRKLFDESGWKILEWVDESEVIGTAQAKPQPPAYQSMRILVSGDDFPWRAQNFGSSIAAGLIRSVLAVAQRP